MDPILIKLTDFGLTTDKNKNNVPYGGTHGFLAPEVYTQGNYFTKSDVWSFGVIMYILSENYNPF
jgi:serine/threonine protein kinase